MKTVDILGVRVACLDQANLIAQALDWGAQSTQRTIFYANAHTINTACKDENFLRVMDRADLVYADGVGVVWAAKLLYGVQLVKITGRVWLFPFCQGAAHSGLRLFLLGGRSGVAELAASRLVKQFPGLVVAGTHEGQLEEAHSGALLQKIHACAPQVLLLGLGTPLQETWLSQHREEIGVPLCWTVGALFDYVAGVEHPVPSWLDRAGMEWFWRLLMDPRGKAGRYLLGNPLFIWRVLSFWRNQR